MEETTKRMLVRLLTNEVATNFSWEGRSGKRVLQNLKIIKIMKSKYLNQFFGVLCCTVSFCKTSVIPLYTCIIIYHIYLYIPYLLVVLVVSLHKTAPYAVNSRNLEAGKIKYPHVICKGHLNG